MSYQVLARKWRPKVFSELVGQDHILKALINALDQQRLHHAYLFTGTRGVGKTTVARILSKCLNCEKGVSSLPCGICSSCLSIDSGSFVDLIEVDAASRTKVEDTRELLDNVQYAPTYGRYKIYLIDEVHMLSLHSFNALLKTLEEPPSHVIFLLATTDPQKLPITVLSRCLQFSLKKMLPENIVSHLEHLLKQENVGYELSALWRLAKVADGSMRDALSLTDQAISFSNGYISESSATDMLGGVDQSYVVQIFQALSKNDAATILMLVSTIASYAPDYDILLDEILSLLHRVAVVQIHPDAIDNSMGDAEVVLSLSHLVDYEDVHLFYQIGLMGKKELPLSSEPRSGFEMVLLRMLAFRPEVISHHNSFKGCGVVEERESLPPQSDDLQADQEKRQQNNNVASFFQENNMLDYSLQPQSELVKVARNDISNINKSIKDDIESARNQEMINSDIERDYDCDVVKDSEEVINHSLKATVGCANYDVGSDCDLAVTEFNEGERLDDDLPVSFDANRWVLGFDQLNLSGMCKTVAANCAFLSFEKNMINLQLDDRYCTAVTEKDKTRIEVALSNLIQKKVRLNILIGTVESQTPFLYQKEKKARLLQQACDTIKQDKYVQEIEHTFSATIDESSIQSLSVFSC